ncbi:hypothetical protein [Vulgatibacter sp.]|uniref:hypothetical protein n=1 Tax=Vulgatibacter sp. TaxID=1971226 RepID=UPI0035642A2C
MDANWPAPPAAIEAARAFLRGAAAGSPVVVPDGDVDGLSSGLIACRTLERLGAKPVVIHPGKGEHVHTGAVRERIRAEAPDAVLVFDQGSRGLPIDAGAKALVVDHHQPVRGLPPDAVIASSFGHEPVANTSWLTFAICDGVADCRDLAWLAILGTVGDLGTESQIPGAKELLRRVGVTAVREAVALLNAPRRHGAHDVAAAWSVLAAATGPADIAKGRVPGVELLQRYRAEVRAEVDRCAKTRPIVAGQVALLAFRSPAKVHPLVAARWTRRFPDAIVIAANYGYLPGRVNFVLRSAAPIDLLAWLHGLGVPLPGDAGYGHARATGGSLPVDRFEELLAAAGVGAAPAGLSV